MLADPRATPSSTLPSQAQRWKYRLRFQKCGDLRLVSHHDLMHCFERMLRRADLPLARTQGFHPGPRMVFALSLALGIAGKNEVLDLELTRELPAAEVLRRLAEQTPPGLAILSAHALDRRASAQVRRAFYRLNLVQDGQPACDTSALRQRVEEVLAAIHLWVERERPTRKRLNIRPYVQELKVTDAALELTFWITPNGTAKPEEILNLLGLKPLLERGAVLERTNLELVDEAGASVPVLADPETEPASPLEQTCLPVGKNNDAPDGGTDSALERRQPPAQRPTALVSGPLSFDS
ncbi:MAG: TIGR03936 family radical SAM-associated protein [Gemmataceae bacterium]|nr:TIGR03936 family radical SAM-associated protein [Gemmataceae bacterium]